MYSHASLIALEETFHHYYDKEIKVTFTDNSYLYVEVEGYCIAKSDVSLWNKKEMISADTYAKNFEIYSSLLNRSASTTDISYEKKIGLYLLEQTLQGLIWKERLKNGVVSFEFAGKHHRIILSNEPHHNYNILILIKALTEGYKFKEERGSHFIVTTPTGRNRAVTLTECDCPEYESHKNCVHISSVNSLLTNRLICKPLFVS